MKILVISNTAWDDNNSFGNSFSNIFSGLEDVQIANVYCRKGVPYNNMQGVYFQIDEKRMIKSILKPHTITGYETYNCKEKEEIPRQEEYYDFARKLRFRVFYWIRDCIWWMGRWKTKELDEFVKKFQPDIMFQPVYYSTYINRIALYFKKKYNLPMVCYISDDNYTLKQFSISPMYWVERLYKRRFVRAVIEQCDFLYVISDVQREEYDKIFKKPSAVLTKCMDFKGSAPIKQQLCWPIKIVYTGNIDDNRGKTIAKIAKCVERINGEEKKIIFDIYTRSALKKSVKEGMKARGVYLKGGVNISEIARIQNEADVLVHVEPLNKKGALEVHQSFSTKIVDYFFRARCILSVGHPYCASISYLMKKNIGLVACSEEEIMERLNEIVNNENVIKAGALVAWNAGKKYHQRVEMQQELMEVLNKEVNSRSRQ